MKTRIRPIRLIGFGVLLLLLPHCQPAPPPPAPRQRKLVMSKSELAWNIIKQIPDVMKVRSIARKEIPNLPEAIPAQIPDSATIYKWIEGLCATPHRRAGTPEGHRGEDYVAAKLREAGVETVTMDPIEMTVWAPTNWKLIIEDQGQRQDFPCFFVVNTQFTGPEGVSGELVYVGEGKPEDFARNSVHGKIVVADVPFSTFPTGLIAKLSEYYLSDPEKSIGWGTKMVMIYIPENFPRQSPGEPPNPKSVYQNAYKNGAAGIVMILKDQPSNINSYFSPYDRVLKPLPALYIGKSDGVKLRELARRGLRATLIQEGTVSPGITHNVWGMLPGMSDEIIMISSHHDSPFQGATEDAAGISMVLSQAYAWSHVPQEKRPRTLLFACDAGHFYGTIGPPEFVKRHPDLMQRVLIDLNMEHLAAKEVKEEGQKLVPTGHVAVPFMFISPNPHLVAAVTRALEQNQTKRILAVSLHLLGKVPPGDGGRYYEYGGVNVINWIAQPYYLLFAEDTLDKIEQKELENLARTATDMVGTFMVMKKENFEREKD